MMNVVCVSEYGDLDTGVLDDKGEVADVLARYEDWASDVRRLDRGFFLKPSSGRCTSAPSCHAGAPFALRFWAMPPPHATDDGAGAAQFDRKTAPRWRAPQGHA